MADDDVERKTGTTDLNKHVEESDITEKFQTYITVDVILVCCGDATE